jgi:hypothetical protein
MVHLCQHVSCDLAIIPLTLCSEPNLNKRTNLRLVLGKKRERELISYHFFLFGIVIKFKLIRGSSDRRPTIVISLF